MGFEIIVFWRRPRYRRRLATAMITEVEHQFRGAEHLLDELLRREQAILIARGIVIVDESARTYHYKNDFLSWSHRFEIRRWRGSEVEKVWVVLSLD